MRALHVIPAVAPRYGGPSTAIWPMTGALRELDIDVEIATTDADGPDRRFTAADLPENAGIVHLFRHERGEQFKYSPELGRWLAAHAGDYDLIHTHSNWNYPVAAACRAARRAGVPYVMRPCGMLSSYTFGRSRWKKRAYWFARERRNVLGAAGFHVTSDEERREVVGLGVTAPIAVIAHGISSDAWETSIEPHWLRQQCPQAGDRPIVIFLSRLHPKKGIIDLLLPALARMQTDAFLAIVGGDDNHAPGFMRRIQNEVYRLGLGSKVALLGPVPPKRRWAAFDGADLFVLPSHSENFGIVVAEAMARGKPVVVTEGVQFAPHVRASKAGTVVIPTVGHLAENIDMWLSDAAALSRAGRAATSYVRTHLSMHCTGASIATLYQCMCRSSAQVYATTLASAPAKAGAASQYFP